MFTAAAGEREYECAIKIYGSLSKSTSATCCYHSSRYASNSRVFLSLFRTATARKRRISLYRAQSRCSGVCLHVQTGLDQPSDRRLYNGKKKIIIKTDYSLIIIIIIIRLSVRFPTISSENPTDRKQRFRARSSMRENTKNALGPVPIKHV